MPRADPKKFNILHVIESLGYEGNRGGMCFGISCMAMQAILANDLATFDERISLIKKYHESKSLRQAIEKSRARVKLKKRVRQEDIDLLEILGFFEGVEVFHKPYRYAKLLGKERSGKRQSFLDVFPLLKPESMMGGEEGVAIYGDFGNIFNKKSSLWLLKNLEAILSRQDQALPIFISANNHAIVISYDSEEGWVLLDPNRLPSIKLNDRAALVDEIFKAFNLGKYDHQRFCMLFQVYGRDDLDVRSSKRLKALMNKHVSKFPLSKQALEGFSEEFAGLLPMAAFLGDENLVNKLLKKHYSSSQLCKAALMALDYGHEGVFTVIYQSLRGKKTFKANLHQFQLDAAFKSCTLGRYEVLSNLINENAALVNEESSDTGRTYMLPDAIASNNKDVINLLLEHGAATDIDFHYGRNALMCAAHHGGLGAFQCLVESGEYDFDQVDKEGNDLLSLACLSGNINLVKYIVEHGYADNLNSHNPVTNFCLLNQLLTSDLRKERYDAIANYLLGKGARLSKAQIKDIRECYYFKMTPEIATKKGYTALEKILAKKPSKHSSQSIFRSKTPSSSGVPSKSGHHRKK